MDRQSILLERMNKEAVYPSLEEALNEAVKIHLQGKEHLMIVKNAVGQYVTVHGENWEIANMLGYESVLKFSHISKIAHSGKEPMEVYNEMTGSK